MHQRHVSGITFINIRSRPNNLKPNNIKVFGSKKTKGLTQNIQNYLRSHMPEGGEP
jgi:hypothetical protein